MYRNLVEDSVSSYNHFEHLNNHGSTASVVRYSTRDATHKKAFNYFGCLHCDEIEDAPDVAAFVTIAGYERHRLFCHAD